MKAHSYGWDSYFANVNDKFSSIFLNLDLIHSIPDQTRPWLFYIFLDLLEPDPRGLSASAEFPTLSRIEDQLTKDIAEKCSAEFVGRITGDSRRDFYFYGKRTSNFNEVVEGVFHSFPGYRFETGSQMDSQWDQYRNVLYPSRMDLQRIANRQVLELLAKKGDYPDLTRPVRHWIYFERQRDGAEFWAAAQSLGYSKVSEIEPGVLSPEFCVSISKEQTADSDSIDNCVLELCELADQNHGRYDGWETEVKKLKT